jgi:hypothetical protein
VKANEPSRALRVFLRDGSSKLIIPVTLSCRQDRWFLKAIDTSSGEFEDFSLADCDFSGRDSADTSLQMLATAVLHEDLDEARRLARSIIGGVST